MENGGEEGKKERRGRVGGGKGYDGMRRGRGEEGMGRGKEEMGKGRIKGKEGRRRDRKGIDGEQRGGKRREWKEMRKKKGEEVMRRVRKGSRGQEGPQDTGGSAQDQHCQPHLPRLAVKGGKEQAVLSCLHVQ